MSFDPFDGEGSNIKKIQKKFRKNFRNIHKSNF